MSPRIREVETSQTLVVSERRWQGAGASLRKDFLRLEEVPGDASYVDWEAAG